MKCSNPIAFAPMSVTLIVSVVYLAILIPILIIHETVPQAPRNPTEYRGLNLTEAWLDLTELSKDYHPYNSRRNDEVHNWLLRRIEQILDSNGVQYTGGNPVSPVNVGGTADELLSGPVQSTATAHSNPDHDDLRVRAPPAATIFNDLQSNYTSTALTSIGVS